MKSIAAAQSLCLEGRFRQALEALPLDIREAFDTLLLRAELLAQLGETTGSLAIIDSVEKSRSINDAQRSQIEFVRSRIDKEHGDYDSELHHLQKSISYAERAHDTERLCLSQIHLLALIADRSGPETASSLMTAVRSNVIKLGNASLLAALHIVAGELDGKRSLLATASVHFDMARKLLQSTPHLSFEAWCQTAAGAISILRCDFERALLQTEAALAISMESGSPRGIRSCLGNLGHV